jgi:hypothetical protein
MKTSIRQEGGHWSGFFICADDYAWHISARSRCPPNGFQFDRGMFSVRDGVTTFHSLNTSTKAVGRND